MNSGEKKKNIIIEIFLVLLTILFMIPVYYLIVTTFKTSQEAALHPMAFPTHCSFDKYVKAFHDMQYPRALGNTFLIAVGTLVLNLTISTMAAYSIERRQNKFNKAIYMLFIAGMMIPMQMGLSSLYKLISSLHLVDNLLSVILINASGGCIASMFLVKSFISSSIPIEIEEAARIDGCSVLGVFFKIVLPLLKPILATLSIIVMLGSWNDFMNPLLFLQSREHNVILQEVSRNIGQFSTDWTSMFPMLVLGILPLTIVYIFLQKFIISGVAAGSVKG